MVSAAWPGVDLGWSRRITVPSTASVDPPGSAHTWHLLDTGPELEERGLTPAGTLLCVHGNPTWSYLWRSLLRASLAQSARDTGRPWRVVAVDQLDMGFSDRTGSFRRLEDRITDLGDLTAALQISGPVVTVGHDWGGIISLGWASRHRDQLAAVVLTNTAVHQPAGAPVPAPLKAALHPAVHGWGTTGSAAFLRITHSLARPRLSREVETAYMSPYKRAGRRAGVGNFVADIPLRPSHPSFPTLEAVAERARTLQVPALLLWGPQDPVFSDRYLRDLIGRFPQADVHRFEGAGHLVLEDRDVAGTVMHWLDRAGIDASGLDTSPGSYSATGSDPGESAGERTENGPDAGLRSYQPMWTELDRRSADPGTAVVDMSSGTATGAAPDAPSGATPGTATDAAAGAPKRLSWADLSGRVRDIAGGLSAVGVRPGDRVNLLIPPGSDLTTLIYACLRIGAVIVVADAGLGTKGLSRAVKGAGPQYIIGIERGLSAARLLGWPGVRISVDPLPAAKRRLLGAAHSLQDIAARGAAAARSGTPAPREPGPDDQAAILFTSGSTGPAKGVVYTHRRLDAMRATIADTYGLGAGTALVAGFAPFALLGPALGATTVTPDMDVSAPKTLTAAALADAAQAIDATAVFASPSALRNVLNTAPELTAGQRTRLGSVKLLLSAGAPIGEALLEELTPLLPAAALHTPYGMTEALPVTDIDLAGIRKSRLDAEASAGEGSPPEAGSPTGAESPTEAGSPAGAESLTEAEQADGPGPRTELARSEAQQALGRSPEDDGGERIDGAGNGVCVGRAVHGARIAISALDEDGAATAEPTAEPAVTGEILARAPHVKSHYDRLWATEQISSQNPGWHRTGDVGHLDASGRLWVEGRLGHIITTAGGVITPVALEQGLEQADGVSRAAVVGVGPAGAQVLVAVLETVPRAEKSAIAGPSLAAAARAAARSAAERTAAERTATERTAARSGTPAPGLAAVLVVPELPTDIRHNAKIDRARLAQWATDVLAGGKIGAP